MHHAHAADSGRHSAAPQSRVSKFLAAGVAAAGAAAIAVTPVSPVLEDVRIEAQAEQRAVALTAAADPLVVFQRFVAETLLNSGYLGSNATNAYAAVASAFVDADLFGELSDIVLGNLSNPTPLLTRLSQFQAVHGDDLQIAFFGREDDPTTTANENYDGVFERYQLANTEFQTLLADLQNYDPPTTDPTQGRFTNAAFEINSFFVFGVLDNLRPLIGGTPAGVVPLFSIPGDFLGGEVAGGFEGALPGFDRLDNLINVLNEQTLVRAAVGPFQTAFFQVAKSLDDALAAYEEGDTEVAINELTNLPLRTVNAFVNGFAPSFSPGGEEWPSLLDPRQQQAGLFKYLAVDLPNQLITALGGTPYVPQVPPAPTAPGAQTSALLAAAAAPEGTVKETEPAAELPAGASADDTAKLVSDNEVDTTAGESGEIVEETKDDTKVTPGKVSYKPGDGLKALKKAGDDFNKGVKNFFSPKKKDSNEGGAAGADTGSTGGTTGGDAGGDNAGGDTAK
ncbi:hypothetical protein [Mycolicibacterium litorale]|uniref:Uncharacterized protein n=1 Tax=Mycolicibacterium litorale TaxID=758802 RepID=A0AAD1MW53_9MYCO|nr:hypothetical protein [Mycolicibacterium litorale]MCV7416906.1 hypothetical protein [Mycolicibacterium litorale]TDY04690.1 hypothetical protein BCL50_3467 [Mycolicibacterium litorale]BBY18117.1 hypothetical protein MLIT_37090 [Mycolicibacterium litorale]